MSAERPILIVDDDGVLRETLADQLAVDGEFTAVAAATIGGPRQDPEPLGCYAQSYRR